MIAAAMAVVAVVDGEAAAVAAVDGEAVEAVEVDGEEAVVVDGLLEDVAGRCSQLKSNKPKHSGTECGGG